MERELGICSVRTPNLSAAADAKSSMEWAIALVVGPFEGTRVAADSFVCLN